VFLVADRPEGQPTMAARRRQQGHKHGRRVLQRLGTWVDCTKPPEARGDMGAERASRGVLAPTMATGMTFLFFPVNRGSRPQRRRRSVATIRQGCQTVVSGCELFVQM